MSATIIRPVTVDDAVEIATIYNDYIANTVITFEEQAVLPAEIARRVAEVESTSLPWLVAFNEGQVLGYTYATPWKSRSGYRFAVEVTVYVAKEHPRRGIGSRLYEHLLPDLQARGLHAVIGGIALPNPASIALHERFGFSKVAQFHEVGFKLGRWVDVGYWQRTF
jgi:L-amino acid N-acyltransferase YncA